MSFHSDPVIE